MVMIDTKTWLLLNVVRKGSILSKVSFGIFHSEQKIVFSLTSLAFGSG